MSMTTGREPGIIIACETERALTFDAAVVRFRHDEEACALLTRDYRAPYTLPTAI